MNTTDATWEAELAALVEAYDLEGLIRFSQQVPEKDTDVWRKEVMESGFMALYSYFSYDQMCGKLGEGGLDLLDEVVEAAEVFHGLPLRKMRAEVLSYRLDEVKETDVDRANELALQAIDELSFEIPADHDALLFRANVYHQLAQLNAGDALRYWQLAVDDLKTGGRFNVWILYHSWPQGIDGMYAAQLQVCAEFNHRLNQELTVNPDRLWSVLDNGVRMQEYHPDPELKKQLSVWFQMALGWKMDSAAVMLLRSAGLLLHKQGKLQQRADYFAKAIECFELFIEKNPAHAMEVNYMANVWEDWAELSEMQGNSGNDYLVKAWEVYQQHEEVVQINFSPLLHYAEFLERLYFNDKITDRPTQEKIVALAVEAEVMGNGYYSGPGMILTRMAISNEDADAAIHHLCRLLLRHELCIDNLIKNLHQSLTDQVSKAVVTFLDQVLLFMEEVNEGYYYSPAFSMEELNKLNVMETANAWQQRMTDIRNRRRLE